MNKNNNEINLNDDVIEIQDHERELIKIGGLTFEVIGYFEDTSKEGIYNKILCLIEERKINHDID